MRMRGFDENRNVITKEGKGKQFGMCVQKYEEDYFVIRTFTFTCHVSMTWMSTQTEDVSTLGNPILGPGSRTDFRTGSKTGSMVTHNTVTPLVT